jgi:hypothetical protein
MQHDILATHHSAVRRWDEQLVCSALVHLRSGRLSCYDTVGFIECADQTGAGLGRWHRMGKLHAVDGRTGMRSCRRHGLTVYVCARV